MHFDLTRPCADCPFLKVHERAYSMKRLKEFASAGMFPCHKTAECQENEEDGTSTGYRATQESQACAGMLIFNERRGQPNQMMRIAERLGLYDRTKLDMTSDVR